MIQRHLESTLRRLAASFPIVAVTGARQGWPLGGGAASGAMQVKEQPMVGPKGERVGAIESNDTNEHE